VVRDINTAFANKGARIHAKWPDNDAVMKWPQAHRRSLQLEKEK